MRYILIILLVVFDFICTFSCSPTPPETQDVSVQKPVSATVSIPDTSTSFLNVRDFGAIAGDTGDDTAAIQAAIDALSATGGTVYLPAGAYRVNSTIVFPVGKLIPNYITNIRIQGESSGLSSGSKSSVFGTRIDFYGSGILFDLYDNTTTLSCNNVQFRDFEAFDCNNSGETYGIRANRFHAGCIIENVGFKSFWESVAIEDRAYFSKFDNVTSFMARHIGIKIVMPNMMEINRCQASQGKGDGLYVYGNSGVLVVGGWYESNTGYGIHITGERLHGVSITGSYLEANKMGGIYITGIDSLHYADGGYIAGTFQVKSSSYAPAIILGYVKNYTLIGNSFGQFFDANSNCVYSKYCQNTMFIGNNYPPKSNFPIKPLNVPTNKNNVIMEPSLNR